MKTVESLRINLDTCYDDEVRARKIWQELFNFYRQNDCPLDRMDNILIDYNSCLEIFNDLEDGVNILWACDKGHYSTLLREIKGLITLDPIDKEQINLLTGYAAVDNDFKILLTITRCRASFYVL